MESFPSSKMSLHKSPQCFHNNWRTEKKKRIAKLVAGKESVPQRKAEMGHTKESPKEVREQRGVEGSCAGASHSTARVPSNWLVAAAWVVIKHVITEVVTEVCTVGLFEGLDFPPKWKPFPQGY